MSKMGDMSRSISWRDYKASLPKEEQREIARDSLRGDAEIVGFNKKPDATRILRRNAESEQITVMLEMARRELRMAEGLPLSIYPDDDDDGLKLNTSYRDLLDLFPKKQQRAIERGARLLQARYANLPAKHKTRSQASYFTRPKDEAHMTYDEFLATMSKSEREEFFRQIKEDGDRRLARNKKSHKQKSPSDLLATSPMGE